ncbi:MAG: hypothetical protein N2114_04320 [Candidatus Goldbacteria bacterium]|nr:hypothetical protein [Candidatus Goldiibacteriota bacterium]
MKKLIFLISILLITHISFSTPVNMIGGQFGISFPGEREITDIFPNINVNTSIYSYNAGIEYNFKFFSYFSIGAGCNYLIKNYIIDFITNQKTFNYNALEPYGIIRGYLQIIDGINIFASTSVGYSFLIGSKLSDSISLISKDVNGSNFSLKFGSGFTYEGTGFTIMFESGYKILNISPLKTESGEILNADGSSAVVNFGGPFINALIFLTFGNHQEQKTNTEIKDNVQNVSELKTEETIKEPYTYNKDVVNQFSETTLKQENTITTEMKEQKQSVEIYTNSAESYAQIIPEDDTEGIIILSPGESETTELEKYILSKRRQTILDEEEKESEEVEFDYDQTAGILLMETELKGKVERAGYVLVERAGFISNNFTEDGFIFTKEKQKIFLTQSNFAYIKLTVGKGAKKGKEFIIYDDSEEVIDNISRQPMGKMINILGVAKVIKPVQDNIFKVQIVRAYDLIKNEMKIKARNDIKDYHKALTKKIKNKNLDVEGYIVKVQKDIPSIKNKDIVYLNIGVSKGILPGEKLDIYRRIYNPGEDREEKFHKIGSLLIVNSVQYSSVGLITQQDEIIKIGDIVKTK